jgi:GTPase Era involved in 16S rRNA processing
MNEKLKELYLQAGGEIDRSGAYFMRNKESTYKFAELIIEQCMHIVDHEVPGMVGVNCMNKINEHFGLNL